MPLTLTLLTPHSPPALLENTKKFALAAYRLLFASRNPAAHTTLPADLASFSDTYLVSPLGAFIVAHPEDSFEPIGIIAYRPYIRRFPRAPPQPSLDWEGAALAEVVRLFVDPSARGQGVASKLIGRMLEEAQGAEGEGRLDGLYLHTQPFLPGAAELWRRKGWTVVDQEEDGVWDTIHMIKWFEGRGPK